jgi:hypothetical protein
MESHLILNASQRLHSSSEELLRGAIALLQARSSTGCSASRAGLLRVLSAAAALGQPPVLARLVPVQLSAAVSSRLFVDCAAAAETAMRDSVKAARDDAAEAQ